MLVHSWHTAECFAAPAYPKNSDDSTQLVLLLSQAALMADNVACSCQISAIGFLL